MKEVEKKDLPEIPGGVAWPDRNPDREPRGPLFPGSESYPSCPTAPVEPLFE